MKCIGIYWNLPDSVSAYNEKEHGSSFWQELAEQSVSNGKLPREYPIANGDSVCDYWIVGDKVKELR